MSRDTLVDSGPALQTAGLVHRVQRPAGGGPHRAVVLIHGLGGDEDVMWIFARTVPAAANWLLTAPRGIAPGPEGRGYSWHSWDGEGWPPWAAFAQAAERVAHFVHSLPGLYGADPEQIYLAGFSQGAPVSFAALIQSPGLAQGVAALMGFLPHDTPPAQAASALRGVPVFMAAGREDAVIPLQMSQASAAALRAAGARLTYQEFDTGHKMSADAMEALRDWWRAIL